MVRPADLDMFALGTAEARALGRSDVATLTDAVVFSGEPVDPDLTGAALRAVGAPFIHPTDAGTRDKLRDLCPAGTADVVVPTVATGADGWNAARVGERVHRD